MKKATVKIAAAGIAAVALLAELSVIFEPWRPTASSPPATVTLPRDRPAFAQEPSNRAGMSGPALVARMREWRAITDKERSDQVEMALTQEITDANAAEFVRGLPPELLQTPVGLRALERWAGQDRLSALEWLSTRKNPHPLQIRTVLRGWADHDAGMIHDYIDNLPGGPWKEAALVELGRTALFGHEPREAITVLRDAAPGENRTWLLQEATKEWAATDPEAASGWVAKVKDSTLHVPLIEAVAVGYASTEPEAATEWLRQSLPPGDALNEAIGRVIEAWVSDARPADAAAWVARQPVGGLRSTAMAKLLPAWQALDPNAVSAWIKTMPPDLRREAAEAIIKSEGTRERSPAKRFPEGNSTAWR